MTMDKMSIKTNTRITIEKSWKENEKPLLPTINHMSTMQTIMKQTNAYMLWRWKQ